MNKLSIAFREGYILPLNSSRKTKGTKMMLQIQDTLMMYGFMLDDAAMINISYSTKKEAMQWLDEVVAIIKELIGLDNNYTPFRPIKESWESSECKLYIETIMHYLTKSEWLPATRTIVTNTNMPTYSDYNFHIIHLTDDSIYATIFKRIASSSKLLTEYDMQVLKYMLKNMASYVLNGMPNNIPLKEILAIVASYGYKVPVTTSTDVLRIASYLSGLGTDLLLPKKFIKTNSWNKKKSLNKLWGTYKFKSMPRSKRMLILELLNGVANVQEMTLRRERWIRLGEVLHPGEYKLLYKNAFNAFDVLRNTRPKSWYSALEREFSKGIQQGLRKLSERPGEFARKLDAILRNNKPYETQILTAFELVSDKVSVKVLSEMIVYFSKRTLRQTARRIFIKGNNESIRLPLLTPITKELQLSIINIIKRTLGKKFSSLPSMGTVYLDTKLKKMPLPSNMNTVSDSLHPMVRGTIVPIALQDDGVVRLYLHWTAGVDLDLSMVIMSKKGEIGKIDYTNQIVKGDGERIMQHSGDLIPDYSGNWAEYIDIDFKKVAKFVRYGLVIVNNFGGGDLSNNGATTGITSIKREDQFQDNNDYTWVPTSLRDSIHLTAHGKRAIIGAINFDTKEWIHIDEAAGGIPITSKYEIEEFMDLVTSEPVFSVYDLLKLHAESRGNLITDIVGKDDITVFSYNDFIINYKKILEYLPEI